MIRIIIRRHPIGIINIIINIIVAIHYQSKYQNGGRIIRALQYPSGGSSGQNFKDERECVFISCVTTISIFFNWPSSTHGHMDRGEGVAHNLFGKWNNGVTRYSTPTSVSCLGCDRVMSVCISRSSTCFSKSQTTHWWCWYVPPYNLFSSLACHNSVVAIIAQERIAKYEFDDDSNGTW